MTLTFKGLKPRKFLSEGKSDIWGQELSCGPGSRVQVSGASGRGKTSLLHFLSGFSGDYDGQVTWDGQELKALTPEQRSQWHRGPLAVVFQTLLIFPDLTGWENLQLREEAGVPFESSLVNQWARHLGIESRLDRRAGLWSQGERQRLAILRTLIQDFKWILLDEPFSHLDKKTAETAWELIQSRTKDLNAGLFITALDPREESGFFTQRLFL